MLVDDEVLVREGYRKLFDWAAYGFEVVCEAEDGKSAIDTALQYRPDLIVMDINIPIISGLDAIAEIKKKLPDTMFIILSGYSEFEYAQEGIRLGVSDYLLKPLKFEDMAVVVNKIRLSLLQRPHPVRPAAEAPKEDKHINKIIRYIHEHLAEVDLSLKRLSEEFYMHPVYLSQFFKAETGMNYHDYLEKARMEKARLFLSTTDMSISMTAEKTGFGNYRSFSREFKRIEGISPSEYRKREKGRRQNS
jgi:two-component system response regulator YesN